jgi:hypothetical protein
MVRTGLRLAEQAALTLFEVPLDRPAGGYQRFSSVRFQACTGNPALRRFRPIADPMIPVPRRATVGLSAISIPF